MSRLGVTSGEVVVLEDSAAGALAGKQAGAYVIAVPTHLTVGEDFSFADARAADLFDAARQLDMLAEAENGGGSRVGREESFFWQKCKSKSEDKLQCQCINQGDMDRPAVRAMPLACLGFGDGAWGVQDRSRVAASRLIQLRPRLQFFLECPLK